MDVNFEEMINEAVASMDQLMTKNKSKAERRRRTAIAKSRRERTAHIFMSEINPVPCYKFKLEHDCFSALEKSEARARDTKREDSEIRKTLYGTVTEADIDVQVSEEQKEHKDEENVPEVYDFEDFTVTEIMSLLAKASSSNANARYAIADLMDVLATLSEVVDPKDYKAAILKKVMAA